MLRGGWFLGIEAGLFNPFYKDDQTLIDRIKDLASQRRYHAVISRENILVRSVDTPLI